MCKVSIVLLCTFCFLLYLGIKIECLLVSDRLVYGASVGPVVKSFGSTSLSFIEGIRPKILIQQGNSSVPLNNSTNAAAEGQTIVPTNGVVDGIHNNSNSSSGSAGNAMVQIH